MARKRRNRIFQFGPLGMDTNLLVVLFFIMVFGFIMIYSASYYKAGMSSAFNNDSMYFLKRQVVFSMVGVLVMLVVAGVNYHWICRFASVGYLACFGFVALLFTPLAITANEATRWVQLGPVQVQVAEPVKILMIVFMATLLTANGRRIKSWLSMLYIMVWPGAVAIAIWKVSDNMSSAVIILGTAAFMMFVVHPEYWKFIVAILIVGVGVTAIVYYVASMDPAQAAESFRFERIRAWLNPYEYETGKAMQALQGLYAIGSGGLWGKGLGNSIQKLGKIPEPYNDYIFSIICEELGIIGAALVILLFAVLIWRGIRIAMNAKDSYGMLVATGITAVIAFQSIINIGVVTNTIPNTGQPLPFIS